MHFLYNHEGYASLAYRHRCPIRLIIQHVLIPNIKSVVHKLIGWWGEDESPNAQGPCIKDPNKKSYTAEESLQH